jgi:preprotein translocase subunit SecB
MSDASNGAAEAAATPRLQILTQFIRDMSFENIAVQKGIAAEGKPDIKVQVNLDAKQRGEDRYEVAIKLNANATIQDSPVFLLELDYAGLFVLQNVPKEQLHPFLMIECPRQMFPYLRRIVGDVTRDGGYPPLNLEPIDFVGLYRANLARQVEQAKAQQQVSANN